MSFWGNFLKILAIGALFVATGPFSFGLSAAIRTAIGIGGVALQYLSNAVGRAKVAIERTILNFRMSLQPGTPIPVVYGRAKVGSTVADWFLDPVGTEQVLYMQTVLAHGSQNGDGISSFEEIWLDNKLAISDIATVAITSSSVDSPTTITTSANHNLGTGNWVVIRNHTGSVPNVNGLHQVTVTGATTFTIPIAVTTGGTGGTMRFDWRERPYGRTVVDYEVFDGADDQNVGNTPLWGLRIAASGGVPMSLTQKAPFQVLDSGWHPTTSAGAGLVAISLRMFNLLVYDIDPADGANRLAFPQGPPGVAAVVNGVRVYDTRDDTWYPGGSNPAMCIRDYLTAPIYGCGFASSLIDDTSFEDAADYCDEVVAFLVGQVSVTSSSVANPSVITTATAHGFATGQTVRIAGHTSVTPDINNDYTVTVTGTTTFTIPVNVTDGGVGGTATRVVSQKRFTCNGVVDTGQTTASNLQELLSSCRGQLVWEQGKFKLRIRSDAVASPTVTLNTSNILGQWSFRQPGLEERFNLVTAAFINPVDGEFKAEQVQWPEVGTTNTYLSADGAFLNRLDLSLPFTNDGVMALGLAQTILKESRAGLTCSLVATEAALALSAGDRVYVTHPTPGWTAKEFWVMSLDLLPNSTVAVALQEYDATAYAVPTLPKPPEYSPRTPIDADDTEDRFTPKRPVKGAYPTWVSDRLVISWESEGLSARIDASTSAFPAAGSGDVVGGTGANYDLGVYAADTYVYVTITPYSGAGATGIAGQPHFLRVLRASTSDPGAPTLTGVSITPAGGDVCNEAATWANTVGWTTTGPNDAYYRVDIEYAVNAPGNSWNPLVTGLTTFTGSYVDDTGLSGNIGGSTDPSTYYRKYRVSLVRKSDDVVIDGPDATTQETITFYTDACIL